MYSDCNTNPCPVSCDGLWSAWSPCSVTCGTGIRNLRIWITRKYEIYTVALHGGTPCPFAQNTEERSNCSKPGCPVNCQGQWSDWSACSAVCGSGIQTRTPNQE